MDNTDIVLLPIPLPLFWSILGGILLIIGGFLIKWLWRTAAAKAEEGYPEKPDNCDHIAYVKPYDDGRYYVSPSVHRGPVFPLQTCYICGATFSSVDHVNTVTEANFQKKYSQIAKKLERRRFPFFNRTKWRF